VGIIAFVRTVLCRKASISVKMRMSVLLVSMNAVVTSSLAAVMIKVIVQTRQAPSPAAVTLATSFARIKSTVWTKTSVSTTLTTAQNPGWYAKIRKARSTATVKNRITTTV